MIVPNACADSACVNGTVGVLLGHGDGTFEPAVTYRSGGYWTNSLTVADVNGDSRLDIVVANMALGNGTVGVQIIGRRLSRRPLYKRFRQYIELGHAFD